MVRLVVAMQRLISKSILVFCFLIIGKATYAQGDGPRAWWPAPNKTNVITPLYLSTGNANEITSNNIFSRDLDIDSHIYGLMLTRVFDVKNHPLGLVAVFTGGSIDGSTIGEGLTNIFPPGQLLDASGIMDLQLIGTYGITGASTVNSIQEMMEPDTYDFILNALVGIKVPIGSYDADELVNMGANRWELRVGLPMMKFFNWGSPQVTSLEFIPNAIFYTKNSDFAGNSKLEQKPVFIFEGHVTQGLNQMLYLSADAFYKVGGETSLDGVDADNSMNGFALGGSLGAYFSENINIKLSYGSLLSGNDNLEGTMFRVFLTYMFQ